MRICLVLNGWDMDTVVITLHKMDDIRNTFKKFRQALNEMQDASNTNNNSNDMDAKPYTRQDELMDNSVKSAKTQFGADFTKFKNPMLYYPKDGDVTLSGEVPELNGAKFQFRYRDPSSNGCYIWVENLVLSEENITTLSRMLGVYKNWKKELSNAEDIKPMSYRNNEGN